MIQTYKIIECLKLFIYRKLYIPIKVFTLHNKKTIDIVFVLSELSSWKTENLYLAMLAHSRFSVHIAVVESTENKHAKKDLIEYLNQKNYEFSIIDPNETLSSYFPIDIVFYQKPYNWVIPEKQGISHVKKSLLCYVNYAFYSLNERWTINQPLHQRCWQIYFENNSVAKELSKLSSTKGSNFIVSGLPFSDTFLNYCSDNDPWCKKDGRKHIIWAPHHTLESQDNWINYSTFLTYHEEMLRIAEKYKSSIIIAFKPHPLLKTKLVELWGEKRTNDYYYEWTKRENTLLSEGEYLDLFMHSDALIHDCGSFTIEYHYTNKPVLYLEREMNSTHSDNMVEYAKKAYDLHYKAYNLNEVESFIKDVINGNDPLLCEREKFVKEYLTPKGQSATENIINSILGN